MEEIDRAKNLEQQRQRIEEELAARKAAEEAKQRAKQEAEAKKRQDDVRRRELAAALREKEREHMKAAMAQQKQEFMERQAAAAANRQRAQDVVQGREVQGARRQWHDEASPSNAGMEDQVYAAPPGRRRSRPQWNDDVGSNAAADAEEGRGAANRGPGATSSSSHDDARGSKPGGQQQQRGERAGADLSAQQRRQVWEEMKAAAARNRRQVEAADAGGLAAFLGVPSDDNDSYHDNHDVGVGGKQGYSPTMQQQQQQQHEGHAQQPNSAVSRQTSDRQRQRVSDDYKAGPRAVDMAAVAPQSRHDGYHDDDTDAAGNAWERRKKRMEEDNMKREAEIKEFQRQHWLEMKAAAQKNRAQVRASVSRNQRLL